MHFLVLYGRGTRSTDRGPESGLPYQSGDRVRGFVDPVKVMPDEASLRHEFRVSTGRNR